MRGPYSTPITPLTGSLFHADPQSTVEDAFYIVLAWSLFLGFIFAFSNIGERAWQWLERVFST